MAILSWTLPIGKSSLEQELVEQVRGQLKALMEKALEAERDRCLQFGFYEHAPRFPLSHSHGDGVTLTNAEQFNGPEVLS